MIDLSGSMASTATAIERACRDSGFFYVSGHGVPAALIARMDAAAREFFALPEATKLEIAMEHGGRAWRGFFPVGAELTSGRPDRKEGIYFGTEDSSSDRPLHGRNLFPSQVPALRDDGSRIPRPVVGDRAGRAARGGGQPRPGSGVLRGRVHAQPDGAVPDLPLPTDATRRRRR